MAITITVTPASPRAKVDFCKFDVAGAPSNRADHSEFRYYLKFTVSAAEVGRSYVFNVSQDGKHQFNNYVFPSAGSYTVDLVDVADDGSDKAQAVTVS